MTRMLLRQIHLRLRHQERDASKGQVALETFIVFIPWLVITFMFFNLLFLLGSLMLNQATVNRGAEQVAAMGCLPDNLRAELESRAGLGMSDIQIEAVAPNPDSHGQAIVDWDRTKYLDSDGTIVNNPAVSRMIPNCDATAETGNAPNTVPSGNFIFLQAHYSQALALLLPVALAGGSDSIDIHRSALTVSNALEGEG
jgi:hypothetical protein